MIDVGRSYERTCRLFGGQFIEFTPESQLCLNPFTHVSDINEALDLLKPLFALMARASGETSDEENSYIEQALKAVWSEKGKTATVTDVASWLAKQHHRTADTLCHLLYPYTDKGMYARFFEGESVLSLDNPLVVLELEELKAKKALQEIVLLVLMYHISQTMYCSDRHQRKSCVIDEAWDLLGSNNTNTAQFIETGYRRARRYNANYVTITQSVHDYYKNPAALAAFENSETVVLMAQKQESIDQLKKSERLAMDGFMERLLKTVKRTDDYSECLIYTQQGYAVFRLILEPFSRILYSSKAEDYEAVNVALANGRSLHDAILEVAKEHLS